MRPRNTKPNDKGKKFKTNSDITAPQVRLINEKGEMLGVMATQKALQEAANAGLDLIEVSPNNTPPVCKIGNFGKMRYEMQKKAADAKKKQKTVDVKEVKMSFNIGKGDFDTKVKHIEKFIGQGHKVKVSIRMRGREITHLDLAKKMMQDVLELTEEYAKPELGPKLEGMQMILILVKK